MIYNQKSSIIITLNELENMSSLVPVNPRQQRLLVNELVDLVEILSYILVG